MTTGRHALVLAAGAGTRFGGGKLTAPWRGRPLVGWAVGAALAARVETVRVVLGCDADAVRAALSDVASPRLSFIEAADWAQGQSASLKAGVRSLPVEAEAAAVFLGDMPVVDPALADRLLDAVQAGAPAARIRTPDGPGHPVAFAAALFPDLLTLDGDRGARDLLAALGEAVAVFETTDPGAAWDIDRPEDLERLSDAPSA